MIELETQPQSLDMDSYRGPATLLLMLALAAIDTAILHHHRHQCYEIKLTLANIKFSIIISLFHK